MSFQMKGFESRKICESRIQNIAQTELWLSQEQKVENPTCSEHSWKFVWLLARCFCKLILLGFFLGSFNYYLPLAAELNM